MRNIFPGHFDKTSSQIWDGAYFMLDANILLNLYRYSESTKQDFLTILSNSKIKKRLWLPYRAAQEYLQNRTSVISEQSKSYTEMISSIKSFKGNLDNKRQHPFVSDKLKIKVDDVLDSLMDELQRSHKNHELRFSKDTIKETIDHLFEEQITDKYDDAYLNKLFTDGQSRYKEKIPPGYKDMNKQSDEDTLENKSRVYGDFILWSQIMDFSNKNKANIILVTDDKKEDWWSISNGKTIGPRPELIEEFESKTNQSILIYQADRFFDYSSKYLKQSVSPESKAEISDLTKRNYRLKNEMARLKRAHEHILELESILEQVNSRILSLEKIRINTTNELEHNKIYGDEKRIQETELKLKEIDFALNNVFQQRSDFQAQLDMKRTSTERIVGLDSFIAPEYESRRQPT